MRTGNALLFLDLDEVLVTCIDKGADRETVVALQPSASEELRPFAGQVIILTHRSRGEARQILKLFPGLNELVLQVVAADDVIRVALATGQFLRLMQRGIEKRLFIRMAERKYALRPERMAIIDDEPANVAGMLEGGAGLGLLAPKPAVSDGKAITFDLTDALTRYRVFSEGARKWKSRIPLPDHRQFLVADLPKTEVSHARHMNRLRRIARKMRSAVFSK